MPGYLLDNNHVGAIFDKKPSVIKKFNSLPDDTHLKISTITLGEIFAGHKMIRPGNPERRREFEKEIATTYVPHALGVSVNTGRYYAEIIGRIWKRHPPADKRVATEAHLVALKVDINDVWTAAIAWEYGLILVTRDKMKCIKEVMKKEELQFEDWFG